MYAPSSAVAPTGLPRTPFCDTATIPPERIPGIRSAIGDKFPVSARLMCTKSGERCSNRLVSVCPACASAPATAHGTQAASRPSYRRSATALANAGPFPPWPLTNSTRFVHRNADLPYSTTTVSMASGTDRNRAGKPFVFAARPVFDGRGHDDVGQSLCDCSRDPSVGIERQVRSVLFERTDRDHDGERSALERRTRDGSKVTRRTHPPIVLVRAPPTATLHADTPGHCCAPAYSSVVAVHAAVGGLFPPIGC